MKAIRQFRRCKPMQADSSPGAIEFLAVFQSAQSAKSADRAFVFVRVQSSQF